MEQCYRAVESSGPLNSTSQATGWLRALTAPAAIAELRDQYPDEYSDIKRNQLDSWFQEFMCDLFGLVTFGGGFLAAHQTLLLALDPTGHRWGPYHPPYVCRKAMLWRACKHLGWPEFPEVSAIQSCTPALTAFSVSIPDRRRGRGKMSLRRSRWQRL